VRRFILFHGMNRSIRTAPNLEGEAWLLHNGYTQAEASPT